MSFTKTGGFLFTVKLYITIFLFSLLTNLHLIYFDIGESPLPANNRITFGVIVLVRDGYDYGNLGNAHFNLDITHTDDWSSGTEAAQVYVNSSNAYTVRKTSQP